MAKQIRAFLRLDKNGKEFQPRNRVFYLDDVLEKDPRFNCPECGSKEIERFHPSEDSSNYGCKDCKLSYEIVHKNRSEDN